MAKTPKEQMTRPPESEPTKEFDKALDEKVATDEEVKNVLLDIFG